MLKLINFADIDNLYVLGDIIDRGPYGIDILKDLMVRENVTLLLGNHEIMMLESLQYPEWKYNLNVWRQHFAVNKWHENGARNTIEVFMCLSTKEQNKIIEYLESAYIAIPNLAVGSGKFYLVHGIPDTESNTELPILFDKKTPFCNYQKFVWGRYNYNKSFFKDGRKVIIGHTPTWLLQDNEPYELFSYNEVFDIDCGCAIESEFSRLCCLRLEDLKEFYV